MHKHKQLYSNTSNGIHTHTQMCSLWLESRLMVFGFVSVFDVNKSFEWWKLFSFYSLLMASGFNSTWSFVFMFYGSHIEWMLMLAQSVSRTSWNQWTPPFSANTGRNRLELFISIFFALNVPFDPFPTYIIFVVIAFAQEKNNKNNNRASWRAIW